MIGGRQRTGQPQVLERRQVASNSTEYSMVNWRVSQLCEEL